MSSEPLPTPGRFRSRCRGELAWHARFHAGTLYMQLTLVCIGDLIMQLRIIRNKISASVRQSRNLAVLASYTALLSLELDSGTMRSRTVNEIKYHLRSELPGSARAFLFYWIEDSV